MKIYSQILKQKAAGKKQFAVLIDPDKTNADKIKSLCRLAADAGVDYFFVGGSLLTNSSLGACVETVKSECSIPVVLFPGNNLQIDKNADAILFLSLISGRNPELLIGKHVIAAPIIKEYGIEVIPTGYMLIEGGNLSSVQYISNTRPIPKDKYDIAACTALAGEMLGLKCIFMDAGSGAEIPVSEEMIRSVTGQVAVPVIAGGGIRSAETAKARALSGADIVVVGNVIEKTPQLIADISRALQTA